MQLKQTDTELEIKYTYLIKQVICTTELRLLQALVTGPSVPIPVNAEAMFVQQTIQDIENFQNLGIL